MTTSTPTFQWSESVPAVEVPTGERLDDLLDQITATARPDFPIAARLRAHGCKVDILLGLPESFVYLDEVSPTRYYVTVGDCYVDGVVSFYLLGQHHTEFDRRHLIPLVTARRVLREFFDTRGRPTSVEWEEGWY